MPARLWPVAFALVLLTAASAEARKPADAFRGKIVTATKPFPTRFKNDRAFIRHMRKVDTKKFSFDDAGKIAVEFMAFFARPYAVTEFTCSIFNVTDGGRRLVDSFPIYPSQKKTRILASYMKLEKGSYEPEQVYLMVVSPGFKGPVIAETKFAIKAEEK